MTNYILLNKLTIVVYVNIELMHLTALTALRLCII